MKNSNFRYSYSLPLILSYLDINVNDTNNVLTQYSWGIFIISLICLLSFLNILGYIIAYLLIQKSNYESKYPLLSKLINRYKKFSLIYFSIEIIICLICLFLLLFFSLLFIYKTTGKY